MLPAHAQGNSRHSAFFSEFRSSALSLLLTSNKGKKKVRNNDFGVRRRAILLLCIALNEEWVGTVIGLTSREVAFGVLSRPLDRAWDLGNLSNLSNVILFSCKSSTCEVKQSNPKLPQLPKRQVLHQRCRSADR